ncbi:hypothetical protein N0V93_002641 [Gnomoniopsis smithogilvyi]|uniref:FAD-binding FR-type domain-containing protein n=1 Tax=Gnomoniopsis smithogilvyi TaxID=1191159 RepID=A0A9W9CYE1_9PEZI|nr:hypothetical protein N0V93_002641 [Gnomoniopsis smithogilvyi]
MALHLERTAFHSGETAIHALLHIQPHRSNPTQVGLPARFALRVAASPLVALGTLDDEGMPWTSVWGGEVGFATPLEHGVLAVESVADACHDPVASSLFGTSRDGRLNDEAYHITREELEGGGGRVMAGLSIDLATRDRVKLGGRLVAGKVDLIGEEGVARVHMAMLVEESLGNCPKYLNKKTIRSHLPSPRLISDMLPISSEALALLDAADLFFLSSTDGSTMDTNHRGGPPGFVRVISNDTQNGTQLIYPEYSGNRLYQTLGNLYVRPLVGICVPDFGTGDVLYLTGDAKILVGSDAARLLPHTKLAVKINVTAARFVRDGLPFRGDVVDFSPYNPPVRRFVGETASGAVEAAEASMTATLVNREIITPSIARFTFTLATTKGGVRMWKPGQHITLDFSEELDVGWSHMRDDDPASLNDDFVRTFTISNEPDLGVGEEVKDGTEVQITVRRNGPATGLLWKCNLRAPLEVPVLGFGGEEEHRVPEVDDGREAVFVAAGVGITPALGQAPGLLATGRKFRVLWSLKAEDLPLAVDVFRKIAGLAEKTTLFVTGKVVGEGNLEGLGSETVRRRMSQEDVLMRGEEAPRKYYLCTAPELLKLLLMWLDGQDVTYESFEY